MNIATVILKILTIRSRMSEEFLEVGHVCMLHTGTIDNVELIFLFFFCLLLLMEDILNLPVQDPPCSEFSAVNLNWKILHGGRQGVDDGALIPYPECPASFRIESRRKQSEGSSSKPWVDGYLEYTLFSLLVTC